jgi:CheY-like chemotaxis protein
VSIFYLILKAIKQDSELKRVPFIFISASEKEETILEGLAEGASGYISKSLDLLEFKAKLIQIIEKRVAKRPGKNKSI